MGKGCGPLLFSLGIGAGGNVLRAHRKSRIYLGSCTLEFIT